jgi:protein-S-isoprenylcysteine O-methyltransferase Ste14
MKRWIRLNALLWVINVGVVKREERYLERKFGDAYRNYKARVRRWI